MGEYTGDVKFKLSGFRAISSSFDSFLTPDLSIQCNNNGISHYIHVLYFVFFGMQAIQMIMQIQTTAIDITAATEPDSIIKYTGSVVESVVTVVASVPLTIGAK